MRHKNIVLVRNCKLNDEILLFKIHNASVEAGYFNSKNKVKLVDHREWFKKKIKDKNSKIYIGHVNDKGFGYVRFDLTKNNSYEISIANLPSQVGKGFGSTMLSKSIKKFLRLKNPKRISAVVKKFNKRSLNCFKKNDFHVTKFSNKKNETVNIFNKKKDFYLELKDLDLK